MSPSLATRLTTRLASPTALALLLFLPELVMPAARAQEAKETDAAVAAVQKLGGKVERDDKSPDKPVVVVNLGITDIKDDALENLKGFTKLRRLTLNDTPITDAAFEHVKGLTTLEKLYLVDTKITDAALEKLKGLENLKILSLAGTGITDAGLEHIKGLSNLQEVFLYGTKVTDEGVAKFKEALPKVKVFK